MAFVWFTFCKYYCKFNKHILCCVIKLKSCFGFSFDLFSFVTFIWIWDGEWNKKLLLCIYNMIILQHFVQCVFGIETKRNQVLEIASHIHRDLRNNGIFSSWKVEIVWILGEYQVRNHIQLLLKLCVFENEWCVDVEQSFIQFIRKIAIGKPHFVTNFIVLPTTPVPAKLYTCNFSDYSEKWMKKKGFQFTDNICEKAKGETWTWTSSNTMPLSKWKPKNAELFRSYLKWEKKTHTHKQTKQKLFFFSHRQNDWQAS